MHKRYSPRKSKIMDLMVNASIRRHMKERRPVYIKWKGSWHTGELLGCGPTYVYKVKSILDRDIYLLERTKLKSLDGNTNDSIILSPGTDVLYYNQVSDHWEKGIILAYNSYGYAKVRWKVRGQSDEYVNWFEAANVSTTPPEGIPSKFAGAKPAGIFDFSDTPLDDSGNDEEPGSPLFHKKPHSKRPLEFSPKTKKAPAVPKLFSKIRSKKVVSPTSKQPLIGKTKMKSANLEDLTVEQLDPQYNPLPPRFAGIPPKSIIAAAPVYYPYPMYVPVPVLVPQYPARPPSISYPFFPAQNFEQKFTRRADSGGIPPHKGGLPLFRIVPKQQSRLLTRHPFSYTGEKLTAYQPKSVDSSRKYALSSSHNTKAYKKSRENKKYNKLSSTSDSSSEDEEISQSPSQPEATTSKVSTQMKHLRPGSGSSAKVRRRASTELNRSFILEKKLSDLPSSSPTIKESGIPTITVTESAGQQFTETVKYDMIREENDLLSRRAQIISSDSGVRTDTSQQPIESVATTTEDDLPSSSLLQDKTATSNLDIPEVVVQDLSDRTDKGKSESGETLLTSDSKMTSESRFNPSHASVEHYLFGSQHFSDVERATTFPRETKLSRHGSAEDLRSKTLTSLGTTLSQSTDLLGDLGTCRSKRRLMHAATSESEFKLGSSDSVSNDESEVLHFKPTDRFNKRLSVAMEEPEDSIPETPKMSNPPDSPPLQSPTNRMSTFLKSLSPARLMAFKPKKRVTFKP